MNLANAISSLYIAVHFVLYRVVMAVLDLFHWPKKPMFADRIRVSRGTKTAEAYSRGSTARFCEYPKENPYGWWRHLLRQAWELGWSDETMMTNIYGKDLSPHCAPAAEFVV